MNSGESICPAVTAARESMTVVAVSCVVIGAARWWLTALPGGLAGAAVLGGLAGLAVVLAALAVPYPRNLLVEGLRKMRHRAL